MTESKLDTTRRIRAELVERWPALFNEGKPVPLAIGIRKTLLAAMPSVTDELIGRVLRSWCFRPQYLAALTAGPAATDWKASSARSRRKRQTWRRNNCIHCKPT